MVGSIRSLNSYTFFFCEMPEVVTLWGYFRHLRVTWGVVFVMKAAYILEFGVRADGGVEILV